MAIVELVDLLDAALQVLNPFLNLNNSYVKGAVVDSLIFESRLDRQHLFLKLFDASVLTGKFLTL